MKTYQTKYGELKDITTALSYPNGALKSCMVNQENCLQTPVGEIIPQYRSAEFGERQKKHRSSLDFFADGQLKSAALDRATPIATPIGPVKAELVTFYQDGSVNRVFPLNGLIDGYWSETNERDMAEVMEVNLPNGRIRAKVIGLHFYPNGTIKSVTLWPGEVVELETPLGPFRCRAGVAFYEDGSVRSVEPAKPVELPTPIGLIKAYDPEIIGMHADQNSVQFSPAGLLTAVTTIHTGLQVETPLGEKIGIEPYEIESYIDPSQLSTVPMKIGFSEDRVFVKARETYDFALGECQFSPFERERVLQATCKDCPDDETCCQNGGPGVGDSGTCCGGGGCGG
ncbi:MAG: hypothetical protein LAT55_13300 [Opitutales bacterium]|nr:hypothetical protein [Opitutales bacterium]